MILTWKHTLYLAHVRGAPLDIQGAWKFGSGNFFTDEGGQFSFFIVIEGHKGFFSWANLFFFTHQVGEVVFFNSWIMGECSLLDIKWCAPYKVNARTCKTFVSLPFFSIVSLQLVVSDQKILESTCCQPALALYIHLYGQTRLISRKTVNNYIINKYWLKSWIYKI